MAKLEIENIKYFDCKRRLSTRLAIICSVLTVS